MKGTLLLELTSRTEAQVWTETVLFAFVNAVALLGNLLTCYAVYKNQRLRTLPNMFVVALGVSDIFISTFCMPFSVATLFHGQWLFGKSFCRFHGFGVFTFSLVSLQTMAIIAVSRYFCVVKPEKYSVVFKKQRSLMYIAIVWCAAFLGSLPLFFFKNGGFEFQPGKAMCLYSFESNVAYTVFLGCVYFAVPLTIITICYTKVFYTVSRSNQVFSHENNFLQLRANVEEAKVTKTLAAVMFGFTCCWFPICIMDTIDAARGGHTLPRQAYLTYAFLVFLSSTINPFIYGGTNKQFRREYKAILIKILCFPSQNNGNS
ncbi:melatonin receptor type 1A-A-like [Oculina patagonica]